VRREDWQLGAPPLRTVQTDEAWRAVHEAACAPYRKAGPWAWHWARGKLGRDPVFRGLLERGDLCGRARIVDIGCGQALLASLLHACREVGAEGGWPLRWPAAPAASSYTGIELMAREVERARAALAALAPGPNLICDDLRQAPLPPCDLVVILDVLHYVDHDEQEALLTRVREALLPRGRLLLRVGDAASSRGYAASQWVDRAVTRVRGHRAPPSWGRPLADWVRLLNGLGFEAVATPMSQGTPFANVLLVADLRGGQA
jgi:SAM-dependent methyltransferase